MLDVSIRVKSWRDAKAVSDVRMARTCGLDRCAALSLCEALHKTW